MASLLNWESTTRKCQGLVLLLSLRTGIERLLLQGRKWAGYQLWGVEVWRGMPTKVREMLWYGYQRLAPYSFQVFVFL